MRCTLDIPHLIPPREAREAWQQLRAPALKALLARARHKRYASMQDVPEFSRFNLEAVAPLLAADDGLNTDRGYWLCMTPVHLQTRHHTLVLADPAELSLSPAHCAALAQTLAEHVRGENMALLTCARGHWYLRCAAPPAIGTSALEDAIGHDIEPHLPQGPDALRWHRLLTELQMLLYAHPVNDARESAGLAPVNSVWLWGGGALAPPQPTPYTEVCSDQPAVRAAARHAGCRIEEGAPQFAPATPTSTHRYFCFHALSGLARRGDWQGWIKAVEKLERDWFGPLQSALAAGLIRRAALVSENQQGVHHFRFSRWDRFRLFHSTHYL